MADDREEFTFTAGNFGDIHTEDLIQTGENFLNGIDITPVDKEEDKPKPNEKEDPKKPKDNKKPEVKEVIVPKNEVEEEDMYSLLEGKTKKKEKEEDEVDDEDEGTTGEATSTSTQTTPEGGEAEDTIYTTIAKELISYGIFSPEEDEEGNALDPQIDSPEEFLERFQVESRRQAADVIDKFLDKYGPEYKDMFENVFVRGVPPTEYLSRFAKIEGIKEMDIKDEANQERVVRELYRSEGRSAEYIEKRITQLKNYSDLADEATEAQRILIEREQKANEESAKTKQAELVSKQRMRSEYVNNIARILQDKAKSKEFDGIPVNEKFAREVFGYITQERYQTPDRQLLTEFDKDILDLNRPENHALKVKMAMLMQIAKTDPQLTKIAKKAVSKESNTLFQGLEKKALKTKSATKDNKEEPQEQPTSWFR